MAEAQVVSKDQVIHLVRRAFDDMVAETEANVPRFQDADYERHEQRRMVEDRVVELKEQLDRGVFDPEVRHQAERALRAGGFDPDSVPAHLRFDLLHGIARALIEQQRLYEQRLDDRLTPFVSRDGFFASQSLVGERHSDLRNAGPVETPTGPSIAETIDLYLATRERAWEPKTAANRRRQLLLLVDHGGPSARLADLTTDSMRAFRDGLVRLRRNHHVGASRTFVGRQTDNENARISARTAQILLQNTRTFLRWAVTEGYLSRDPSAGLQVTLPKTSKARRARRPFEKHELEQLFRAPMFTGCAGLRRRHKPGPKVYQDAEYWLPILAYYTGARAGELVQLHCADVVIDGPIPRIRITEEGGGPKGSGTEKHVKSRAGIRDIPLHPHLVDLGFLPFVEQRLSKKGRKRLFFEVPFGTDGQASTAYSKRFARTLRSCGLTDPALVFHSFRHTAQDAFRNAREVQYVIDRIVGHAALDMGSQYGRGPALEVLSEAVDKMKLPLDLRAVLKPVPQFTSSE